MRLKWAIVSAYASSVRRCAIKARRANGTLRSHGESEAEYSRCRALSSAGQEQDPGPGETRRDVADGRELGGAGEDDDAHRHRLDEGETGFAGGQPVDEPEADGRDGDADRVGGQPAPAGGEVRVGRRAQRRKVFAQVPSHTT